MPNDPAELRRQVDALLAAAGLTELDVLGADLSMILGGASRRPRRPHLRGPRRDEVAVYRVRVDLNHAKPPIWRELDVRSNISLDVLHQVLQAAFGWSDSHLHRFSLGGGPFDLSSELFLCPYDVEEGEDEGTPASEVRLDETLQEPGDVLRYAYDYGDSWELTLKVKSVRPAAGDEPVAVCTGGRRAAPPENCGGYTDAADLATVLDDPAAFDVAEVNAALQDPFAVLRDLGAPARLVELVGRLSHTERGDDLAARTLQLTGPLDAPSSDEIAAATQAWAWFLDRAGGDGIELTSAGYLRPADVTAACAVVPTVRDWIGTNNREALTAPLLDFRTSLQCDGLLRKYKGKLLLTRAGAAARDRPAVLWDHLVSVLRKPARDDLTQDASLLLLLHAATTRTGTIDPRVITASLSDLGWAHRGGGAIEYWELYRLAGGPLTILRNATTKRLGLGGPVEISPVAAALARAALLEQ